MCRLRNSPNVALSSMFHRQIHRQKCGGARIKTRRVFATIVSLTSSRVVVRDQSPSSLGVPRRPKHNTATSGFDGGSDRPDGRAYLPQ